MGVLGQGVDKGKERQNERRKHKKEVEGTSVQG